MREAVEPGGWVELVEGWDPNHWESMRSLVGELPLVQETIVIAGQRHQTPRLTSWHGDPEAEYRYSGRLFVPAPWTPALAVVLARVRADVDTRLNACLANYYRCGDDAMGAHADAEPELGPDAPRDVIVASVSLGARRRFVLAPKKGVAGERRVWELGEGSLFVMGGALQMHWKHHVPRTAKAVEPRLNLTFRIVRGRRRLPVTDGGG